MGREGQEGMRGRDGGTFIHPSIDSEVASGSGGDAAAAALGGGDDAAAPGEAAPAAPAAALFGAAPAAAPGEAAAAGEPGDRTKNQRHPAPSPCY